MIYNEGNSELNIRLHVAEMLKDMIEQDNYEELCNKALKFIIDGIDLPKIKKSSIEEASDFLVNTMSITKFEEIEPEEEFQLSVKETELERLCKDNILKKVIFKDHECYVCGYSPELDSIILGSSEEFKGNITLYDNDVLLNYQFDYYYLISKDKI